MKIIFKGGAGSGNFSHAGRPGKIGGSAPGKGGGPAPTYDREKWAGMDMGTRRTEWGKLSASERDAIADARHTIKNRISTVLVFAGERPALQGDDVKGAVKSRLAATSKIITPQALEHINRVSDDFDDALSAAGVSAEDRYKLGMDAADALVVQENECMGRQLGDHGIAHIGGNIDFALAQAKANPAPDTPEDIAKIYVANIYHDVGYLTPPSHDFLDEGHPRWSTQYYDSNVRAGIQDIFGEDFAGDVSHIIRTHDSTDIDWQEDFIGSATRVADNMSLFKHEKLPPVFKYVDGNVDLLQKFQEGSITLDAAKAGMIKNINSTSYKPWVKRELTRAVGEIGPYTGKFTLGMLGAEVTKFQWSKDHMVVHLKKNDSTKYNKIIDLYQRQFGKLAETYGYDPKKFTTDLKFTFSDRNGNPLLESVIE